MTLKNIFFLTLLGITSLFALYNMIPEIESDIFGDLGISQSKHEFVVKGSFYVTIGQDDFTVPVGYRTQLESAPDFVKNTSSPYLKHFIMHSYLYDCPGTYSRFEADAVLYNALLDAKLSRSLALKHYLYLRFFGGKYFGNGKYCYVPFD